MNLKMVGSVLATLLLAVSGGKANAYFHDGNDVLEVCSIKEAEVVCSAYLSAVADSIISNNNELGGRRICLPERVTAAQIRASFVQFLDAHPHLRKAIAASIISAALSETYPCVDP